MFENLLASYNEDTKTTARNKSGSFYTPREVVGFMVDEALLAYLTPKIAPAPEQGGIRPREPGLDFPPPANELSLLPPSPSGEGPGVGVVPDGNETRLRALLDFASRTHDFTPAQVDVDGSIEFLVRSSGGNFSPGALADRLNDADIEFRPGVDRGRIEAISEMPDATLRALEGGVSDGFRAALKRPRVLFLSYGDDV